MHGRLGGLTPDLDEVGQRDDRGRREAAARTRRHRAPGHRPGGPDRRDGELRRPRWPRGVSASIVARMPTTAMATSTTHDRAGCAAGRTAARPTRRPCTPMTSAATQGRSIVSWRCQASPAAYSAASGRKTSRPRWKDSTTTGSRRPVRSERGPSTPMPCRRQLARRCVPASPGRRCRGLAGSSRAVEGVLELGGRATRLGGLGRLLGLVLLLARRSGPSSPWRTCRRTPGRTAPSART